MAPELGFSNVFFKLNYDGNFSPVEDVEFVKRETGLKYVSRAEYLEHEGKVIQPEHVHGFVESAGHKLGRTSARLLQYV